MLAFVLTLLWLGAATAAVAAGWDYYMLPHDQRAFSELARTFSPTGLVGHGLGVVGAAMMVIGVVGYAARKRMAWLERLGTLRYWLQVHIFLCTLGPFFVLLHTTFKIGGLVSVAFWSMVVVVASGILGRFVYVRIPKTLNGRFLNLEAVQNRTQALLGSLRARADLPQKEMEALLAFGGTGEAPSGLLGAVALALKEDFRRSASNRRARRFLVERAVPDPMRTDLLRLVRDQARLRQQTILLGPFQRLFRYWHVVHLPLAVVMFLILGIHVTVSILFGYTWIF